MTTITRGREVLTFINVFTTEPANQARVVELLKQATSGHVESASGFILAALHRSLDGTKITMYAQWRSMADYQAMRGDPGPLAYFQEALSLAKFEPGS